MPYRLLLPIFLLVSLMSCSADRLKLYEEAEQILPGEWAIESIQLPAYGPGITYQGNTFVVDTILFDVGSVVISDFTVDHLNKLSDYDTDIICTVTIGNEDFPFKIAHLSVSKDEWFSQFEYNGPDGSFPIVTPGEQFIWSSHVFNNNYIINVIDEDHIQLLKANDRDDDIISLSRK